MMRDQSRKIAWPVTRLLAAVAVLSAVTAMPASVLAQSTVTWTGGGGNGSWGTGGNWGGGSAPAGGSTLVFGGSAATFTTSTNTLSSGSFAGLLFNANGSTGFASAYTLSGNAITLSGSIATTAIGSTSDAAITDTLSLPIALTSGGLTVSTGAIHNVTVSGGISGGGGLTKSGSHGILTLSGTNSYSGVTTAGAGVLRFTGTSALYGGDTAQWTSTNLVASSGAIMAFNVGGSGQFTTGNVDTILGSTGIASGAIIGIDTTNNSGVLSYTPSGLGGRGIAKFGTGQWTFGGTVSSAPIVVDSGTLALTQDNTAVSALRFGAVSRSTAGSVLDLTNASLTSTSLLVQAVGSGTSVISLGNGRTLTTNGNVSLTAPGSGNQFLRFAVSGTGGTWNVSGTSFVVGTADGTLNQERLTADLSGLGTFNANLGSTGLFRIGSNNPFNNGPQGASLTLATNSTITSGTLDIGNNQGPYGSTALRLGSGTNTINVNTITVGAGSGRGSSSLSFSGSNGSLTIKAADGASAAALNIMAPWNATSVSTPSGLFDVSGHAVNMLFDTVDIFRSVAGGQLNAYKATFVFDSGTVQATTFNVGRWSGSGVAGASASNPLVSTAFIGGTGAAGGTAIASNNYSATASLGAVTVSNVSATVTSGTTNPGMQGFLNIGGTNTSVTMTTLSIAASTSGSAGSGALNSLGVVTIAGGSVGTTGAVTIATKTAANGATVTGSLAINGGIFKAGGNIVGGGGSSTLSLAGGTLDLGGNSIGGSGTLAISTLSFASGTLQNVAGINAGAGWTMSGAGTLTLAGSNAYTGVTTVSGGTLALGSVNSLINSTLDTGAVGTQAVTFAVAGTNTYNVGGLQGSNGLAIGGNTVSVGANGASTSFGGAISGVGGILAKTGTGTLTLSASNSHTGGTQINGGVIALGDPGALGSAGAISFGGGTLQFSGTNTTDYSSRFSTANNQAYSLDTNGQSVTLGTALTSTGGSLTKSGSGTLTLTQDATFAGTTAVTGDTLALGTGGTAGSVAGPIALSNTAALVVNRSNDVTLGGIISGAGSLTKQGAGTLSLTAANTYTGLTTISAGTIALSGGSNRLAAGGTVSFAGAGGLSIGGSQSLARLTLAETVSATLAGGGTLSLTGASFLVGGTTQGASQVLDASGLALFTSTNTGGTFKVGGQANGSTSAAALVLPAAASITASSILIGNDANNGGTLNSGTVTLGTTTTLAANTITLGSNQAQGVLRYGSGTNPTLTIRGTDGSSAVSSMTIGTSGGFGNTANSLIDLATNVTGTSRLDALVTTLVIGQQTRGLSINQSLTVTGGLVMQSGTLTATTITLGQTLNTPTISSSPVISGSLSLSGGTVNVGTLYLADQSWSAGTVTGAFRLDGGGTLNAGTIASGTGTGAGAATRTFTWNDGTIANRDASTDLSIGSGIAFTLASTGTHRFSIGAGRSGTVASNLAGAGGTLEKAGAGTLFLSGSNGFTGATTISAGVLSITDKTALQGTSGVSIAGGAGLRYTGGADTFGKNITVTAGSGTGTITNAGGGLLTLSGTLSKDNSVLRLTGGSFNVTGLITGTTPGASDLVVDAASVTLSNTNTYDGPTFVYNSGTLSLGIDNAIPSTSAVTLGNATGVGALVTGTFSDSIAQLIFSGSGGTLSLSGDKTGAAQLATAGSLTLGSNANLVLTSAGTSAGLYRLIAATSISGTFAGANVTGVPTNYTLLYTGTEIGLQRKADQATTFTLTTGTVTRALVNTTVALSGSITNTSPAGSADLGVSLSSGGVLSVTGLSSGTSSLAPQASTSVAGTIQAGGAAGSQSWSVINTDSGAIQTTSTASGSLTVVEQRVFTTSTSTLVFGLVHLGSSVGSPTLVVTSTGLNDVTANATLGSFTGGPSGLALNLTGGSAAFLGVTSPQSATYTLAGTAGTAGMISGTFTSNVSAEFGSIADVTVAVSGQVFSGTATWNVAGGGAWGTGASANWTSDGGVGAAPGTFAGYGDTDVAIFAGSQGGTSTILLDGATPSLASLVFSNTTGSYALDQGSGGSLTLASASGTPTVDVQGLHEIKTAILGSQGLQKLGAGTLVLSGSNGYSGVSDVSAGVLSVNGSVGGAVNVASAAVLAGTGTVGGLVSVLGGGSLAPGDGGPGTFVAGGGLSLAAAAILNFQLSATNYAVGGGFNDLVTVTGDFTLDGVLDVAAIGGGDFTAVPNYTSWRLVNYSGGTFTNNGLSFGSMPSLGGGDRYFAIDTSTTGQVNLVIVPEPGGLALAGIGAAAAAWVAAKRRGRRAA